jgi:hypothetical protein
MRMDIIRSFSYVESLLSDFLGAVPYEPDATGQMPPDKVWSPRLATILQETCSQLDSYCRHDLVQAKDGRDHTMADYQRHFGAWLEPRKVFFWQGESGHPVRVQPFQQWAGGGQSLDWWVAYNKVKHDRISHRKQATLKNCVDALAGLFLVIVRLAGRQDAVKEMLAASGWWRVTGADAGDIAEGDETTIWQNLHKYSVIETNLFSFPLGWWRGDFAKEYLVQLDKAPPYWGGFNILNNPAAISGSDRWKLRFYQWRASLRHPFTKASPFTPLL